MKQLPITKNIELVKLMLETNSYYQIEEKNTTSYAMPIKVGFSIYLYADINLPCNNLFLDMVIRWTILYELFLIMETSDKKDKALFQLHMKNSIPFLTEWLDDLMLFNWELDLIENKLFDCNGIELPNSHNILQYCKYCFAKIEGKIPIDSLHCKEDKDCSHYKNRLQRSEKLILQIKDDLNNIASSIRISFEEGKSLSPLHVDLNKQLNNARNITLSIAQQFYKYLTSKKKQIL